MEMGKILARQIPDDPLIPLMNKDAQLAVVVATRNSSALSNVVIPTRPRGSGRLNPEPSSSRHNEELLKKNAELKRQLKDVQKSINELKSPKSHQQTLDLDSAPLNLSITAEPYQEGFKIPHLETYDGLGDPDEHLHTYQAIMRIQNANDAMMCKVFPVTLKSTARRWYHKLPKHSIDSYSQLAKLFSNKFASQREIKRTTTKLMQVHQKEGESLRDYMQRFNKATLDIDNVPDTICLSALLHGLKPGRFLDDLLENPPKSWNEVNDRSASFILSEDFQSSKRRADDRQGKDSKQPEGRDDKKKQKKPYVWQPTQTHFVQEYGRSQVQGHQLGNNPIPFQTRGQSARGYKAYTRQVMTVNKNRPLKQPFEEVEWENVPITFSSANCKRADGEPNVMMPHADPFVATIHIGNHNVNKVFIDTGSSPDILYWSCFQKMQLNPSSLQKYEGPIYGFNNQPVPVEGGVGVLKGNQKMAKACYQDTFKKVELAAAPRGSSESHRPTQLSQQTMSISDIEHRPKGVKQKVEPVEPVEAVPLKPDVPERTVKIGTKLTEEERAKLLEFLRVNQDVFSWTTDEMLGIPTELIVYKLSTDPTNRPVVQKRRLFSPKKQVAIDEEIQKLLQAGFIRRVEYSKWVSNLVLIKKSNGKWKMCIDFTNLNEVCPKDPHPLPNVEKLVERAAEHERMSFLDASSSYHQAIQQMEPLKTVKDVQRLTDCVAALHKFIARSVKRCLPFFKALREPKNFQWTDECQQAFDELKRYLASAPLLSKPMEGESLYLYLGVTEKAVSSILLREENKHQKLIYYVNKIVVYTNLPLRKILQRPKLSGRLIGWSVELSEYDLKFQPRTTIKGQAVVDFLVVCLSATVEERAHEYPIWVLYVDKATNIEGSGAGVVLVGPDGFKSEHALRFKFQTTNNAAEYEALVYGLNCEIRDPQLGHYTSVVNRLKSEFVSFQIDKIPRVDNQRADDLSKLASSQDINPQRSTTVEYLRSGELPEDPSTAKLMKRKVARFTLLDNQLYKRVASMPLLRYLTPYEAEYAVKEVHEGVCGTHIGGRTLAQKLLRHGYYWPTMVEDAQSYVKKCSTCQFNADDIHMPSI
ncbi:hypothetical protein SLEP1_g34474 [Rubroshorea leprosula]|uniref:Uncharacterized protein n=1 Tax=Rubroshorea leprosula TaxID=152421 RepID=A0AAV5KK17_9ROSI|nr:hypothetical protein SLEP1_g34474 [Rubroshorea leprosula]